MMNELEREEKRLQLREKAQEDVLNERKDKLEEKISNCKAK